MYTFVNGQLRQQVFRVDLQHSPSISSARFKHNVRNIFRPESALLVKIKTTGKDFPELLIVVLAIK